MHVGEQTIEMGTKIHPGQLISMFFPKIATFSL
jgi:hypothetical protein